MFTDEVGAVGGGGGGVTTAKGLKKKNMRLQVQQGLVLLGGVWVCVCVGASSHLWQEWGRRSQLAQVKPGVEVSWLAH